MYFYGTKNNNRNGKGAEVDGTSAQTPETYAEHFIRINNDRIKSTSIENILFAFCEFMRPNPGRYTTLPCDYVDQYLQLFCDEVKEFELSIVLKSFTLFINHCNLYAVNWVYRIARREK